MPPIRAETSGFVTTSSTCSDGSPSRFIATAVASTSMCPISSVPVCSSMSRYFFGPRAPQAWNRYWFMTRISPSGPPIACCSIRANTGLGLSTRTVYASSLWWKNMCLLGRLTFKAFPGASGAAAGSVGGLETNPALASALRTRAAVRLADGLGLWRATLTQPDREDDHRRDGEELRLPVLQGPVPELRAARVLPEAQRRLVVVELVGVVDDAAGDELGEPRPDPDGRHDEDQRVGVHAEPPAAGPGPRRGVRPRVRADLLLLVGLGPLTAEGLGLRRAALHEEDRREDEQRELQVLRLPVLHDVDHERRGRHEAPERHRGVLVGELLVVEVAVPDERLRDEGREEDPEEEQRQRVLADPAPHRANAPITKAYASSATTNTSVKANTVRTRPPPRTPSGTRSVGRPAPGT